MGWGRLTLNEMISIILIESAMRYPAEHKQQTRERIVKAAARRFRSRGSEGAAIGDLMRDLRLTHGGFYRHFASKEDLFVQAFEHSLEEIRQRFTQVIAQAPPESKLKALIDAYLGTEHCTDPAGGCPFAVLAPEVARRSRAARAAFQRALSSHIKVIAALVPGRSEEERECKARMLTSGMAGTLAAARMMTDDRERQRLLDAAKKFYLEAVQQ
jgi:TetR/AcrR family transcriptional regulator, transcriptional repressor for nem operon